MANAYQIDADSLFSDEDRDEQYTTESTPSATVPQTTSVNPAVPRALDQATTTKFRSFSSFQQSGHSASNERNFANNRSYDTRRLPSASSRLHHSGGTSNPVAPAGRGAWIHPQRMHNFDDNPHKHRGNDRPKPSPPVAKENDQEPVGPNVASILPDDEFKDQIIALTKMATAVPDEPAVRKRPSARKRSIEPTELRASKRPSNPAISKKSSAPGLLGQFGDLKALATGPSLLSKSAPATDQLAIASMRTQESTALQELYRAATVTEKSLAEDARREAAEVARVDEAYRVQRKKERHDRRIQAQQMRTFPTVATDMRDSYELQRVENYLFGDSKARPMSCLDRVNLVLKDLGTDAMTEDLWTIILEII